MSETSISYDIGECRGKIISNVVKILNSINDIDNSLQQISNVIPEIYNYPNYIYTRIVYNEKQYKSKNFKKLANKICNAFETPDRKKGVFEVYYSNKYLQQDAKSNLFEDPGFMENLVTIITGVISRNELEKLLYDNTERLKELKGINRTTEILEKGIGLDESLQEICSFLPEAWQYPKHTVVRIIYEQKTFKSKRFKETPWVQKQVFETFDNKKGSIEVFYLKDFPELYEGPFLKEERNLIDNLAALISGAVSKFSLKELLISNTERLKELRGINITSMILSQGQTLEESLQIICSVLPEAWQYPEYTVVRIKYKDRVFESNNFKETIWKQEQVFEAPNNIKGVIEIFYLKEFPELDEGPFLQEERNLLINLSNIISGSAAKDVFVKLSDENKERLKELKALNNTSEIIAEGNTVDNTLMKICSMLPDSWQYPEHTVVRIKYKDKEYTSQGFTETVWGQKESFITLDNKKGSIDVFYTKEFAELDEGPFLKEERHLLINLGKLISGYINDVIGREIYREKSYTDKSTYKPVKFRKSMVKDKQPLQLFFNKQVLDKYIYLDMMKYKVKEILFVATLYDAFVLESEDGFFEQFMGEIYQYSLFSLPRITGVTSSDEAMELLETSSFDLVILMVGIDTEAPIVLSERIKQKQPDLSVYLLLNKKSNIQYFEDMVPTIRSVNELLVWSGDSQIFFSIVKSIEDKTNVENDTQIGLVRVILLIEDSAVYYSKYLQILFSIVFGQIQKLLPEAEKNEMDKISKMRSRPKVLLAKNYEDAMSIFNKYKDFILCVISDVEFEIAGKSDKKAGEKFIKYAQSQIINLPVILQSSDANNKKLAEKLKVSFLDKNSDSLLNDLQSFLTKHLGFGDFIFRGKDGKQVAVAKTLREFANLIVQVPDDVFFINAEKNQYSIWLMARGEIQLAKKLNPIRISDFETIFEAREFFVRTIKEYKEEKKKGKVLNFEDVALLDEKNIVVFSGGSLGGKGRGLAFVNTLIYNLDFSVFSNEINIRTPITCIIGTDEFTTFIERNKLFKKIINPKIKYQELKKLFVKAELSTNLIDKLKSFVGQVGKPIAVRSSSLSEDSFTQPFAGVFDTYIIPNSQTDKTAILDSLVKVIKMVFASVYSDSSRTYFKAINHKVEEEKMAIVLQELVGNRHGDYYYPHISGVAQSYNYYPVGHMKPDEGYALVAVGLGSYVVDGWSSYRFSPKYPKIEMSSIKDLLNSSQQKFYAVDCLKEDINYFRDGELASLAFIDIGEAEKHGTLQHCASVYNPDNDRIEPGLNTYGPRVINFENILKYDYIPFAKTIEAMLNTIKDALGSPVEIEYAVDLTKSENGLPSFYLLQIKPMVGNMLSYNVDFDTIDKSKLVLFTKHSLGNGEVNDIIDVIFVDNNRFDKMKTIEMVKEIDHLNKLMIEQKKEYILIGPGRWGTRDQFIGIPVSWPQISNAKVIVEISLANFPLESSLGSHFFHNVTSRNIGYFSILDSSQSDFVNWDILNKQKLIKETKYFKHVEFSKPLSILMNGKERTSGVIETD